MISYVISQRIDFNRGNLTAHLKYGGLFLANMFCTGIINMTKNRYIFSVLFAAIVGVTMQAQSTFFEQHIVTATFGEGCDVFYADINNDNDLDILACRKGGEVVWYENKGFQGFVKINIGDSLAAALWINAADLDNDGDMDLMAAGQNSGVLYWFENDGQELSPWLVEGSFPIAFNVVPVDMDNDGDQDLVAIGRNSNKISWFENKLNTINSNGIHENINFNFSPYPTTSHLPILGLQPGKNKQIRIYNSKDQLVISQRTKGKQSILNVPHQKKGMYHIPRDDNHQKDINYKVIKQ